MKHGCGIIVLLLSAVVMADEGRDEFVITAYIENDGGIIKTNNRTDRYYTNGVKLTATHHPAWAEGLVDQLDTWLPLGAGESVHAVGYAIGQEIYTPDNIDISALQPGDQPYAGWLYGGLYVQRQVGDTFDHLEINLGIIGPSSLAEEAQQLFHDVFDAGDPDGWDHQLRDEFGFDFIYRRKWRFTLIDENDAGFALQAIPQAGFILGNAHRQIGGGLTVRLGCRLPDDFGPGRLGDVSAATARVGKSPLSAYGFVQIGGRYVEHNVFIEGNNYHDSNNVDEEPWVGQVQFGVVIRWCIVQVSYAQTYVFEEFDGQDGSHGFGSLVVSLSTEF